MKVSNSLHKTLTKENLKICPYGQFLVQKDNYQKLNNGCGPEGSTLLVLTGKILAPHFQNCCGMHDMCYETCNPKNRDNCDNEFHECMLQVCNKRFDSWYEWVHKVGCRFQGGVLFHAVKEGGSDAFNASQNRSCVCK